MIRQALSGDTRNSPWRQWNLSLRIPLHLSIKVLVARCDLLYFSSALLLGFRTGVISQPFRSYPLSPRIIPSCRPSSNSLYTALSFKILESCVLPGHFTTQLIILHSALHINWTFNEYPFLLTYSYSCKVGAWIRISVPSTQQIMPGNSANL